jgi:hypothetical protein
MRVLPVNRAVFRWAVARRPAPLAADGGIHLRGAKKDGQPVVAGAG